MANSSISDSKAALFFNLDAQGNLQLLNKDRKMTAS